MDNLNQTEGKFSGNVQQPETQPQMTQQYVAGQPNELQSSYTGENAQMQYVPPVTEGEKKLGIGARIGYFFLAFAPLIVSLALQFAISFVVLIVVTVMGMMQGLVDPNNYDALMEFIMQQALDTSPMITGIYHVIGSLVFFLWYYFSIKKPRPTIKKSFGWFNGKSIAIVVLTGVTLNLIANGTVVLESILTPSIVESYMELAEIAGLGIDPFVIFASIFLAPIGEEFLCRGLTLKFANKAFGNFWAANILQAILFGALHANWVQGIYAFLIGLALGWLTKRYNSIIPAMICHAVVNFSSTTWIPIILAPVPVNLFTGLLLTVIPAAVTIWLFVWDSKKGNA